MTIIFIFTPQLFVAFVYFIIRFCAGLCSCAQNCVCLEGVNRRVLEIINMTVKNFFSCNFLEKYDKKI